MSVFGQLLHVGRVETAVLDTLRTWFDTYLTEIERQDELDYDLPRPRSYAFGGRWPEDQLPCVVIETGATREIHKVSEKWRHRAAWEVSVTIVVSAAEQDQTRHNAYRYGRAIVGALMQHRSLGAGMRATDWLSEDPSVEDPEMRRTLIGVRETFAVEADDVLSAAEGPSDPDSIPADWVEVDTVQIATEPEPIDE